MLPMTSETMMAASNASTAASLLGVLATALAAHVDDEGLFLFEPIDAEGTVRRTFVPRSAYVSAELGRRLGVPRLTEFQDALRRSQCTVLVLSPAYLAREGFDQFFTLVAQIVDLETEAARVIPLVLRAVELPASLAPHAPSGGLMEGAGLAPLAVLDATAPDRWPAVIERLCAGLGCPLPGPAPRPACPYPGMLPFTPGEAGFFRTTFPALSWALARNE